MIIWGRVDPVLLQPHFRADVEAFLAESPHTWYVTEGFRSIERSDQLYALYKAGKGPRAAPGGKSAHNFGLAIDVALDNDDRPGLQPTWDVRMAGWAWLKARSVPHPRLKNGWSFSDWPHIERYKWQRFK
jgi:hypothetical protein